MKKEGGYTLLTVMLIILVFTTLGAAILTATIGGAKRTEIREETIIQDSEAIKAIEEGVAVLKNNIQRFPFSPPGAFYQQELEGIISSLLTHHSSLDISDLSHGYTLDLSTDYTRVYEISSKGYKQNFSKTIYITAMPSFLKYGAGARDTLSLHGGMYIDGDIYANNRLFISDEAKYIYEGNKKTVKSYFPTVEKNTQLILNGVAALCKNSSAFPCFDSNLARSGNWQPRSADEMIVQAFSVQAPVIGSNSDYIDVKLLPTVSSKLKEMDASFTEQHAEMISAGGDILTIKGQETIGRPLTKDEYQSQLSPETMLHEENVIGKLEPSKNHLFLNDSYLNTEEITLQKDKWLVVLGDLILESAAGQEAILQANMIVFGDVVIRGDHQMDSVMYVLGKTTIFNANIKKVDGDGELILMSRGRLDIALLNSFNNPASFNEFTNQLNAFIYTDEDAEIYSVGSYVYVEGGIFSKGSLEFNSFRGDTAKGQGDIVFSLADPANDGDDYYSKSRLFIRNDQRLFMDKQQALPAVEKLDVIEEPYKKIK
ncbi:type II secretion system protein [Jeotgalibacillus campisalis]|uniref:Uncharacterized protein n=1 Tax=Jeotgalibacillus campisalis TaxID=220754 RepID=A0A0C2RWS5_9BACL|nr:type II secretion system protein [Jeotgalibacillus campisalis]KIL46219.1 hypothetical protein KR50_28940 [Jeotgalibacillus campisalis]